MDSSWRTVMASVCLLIATKLSSVEAQVDSGSAPSFTLKPKDMTEVLHSTVVFQCKATGVPMPTIKWVKYTDSGETEIRTGGRFIISSVFNLFIFGILWSDEGRYGCVAQNENGRVVADAYLTVITESPPSWHIKPHNVTLYNGQKYTLPCRTHGYPVPYHMWTKNGFIITDTDVTAGLNDLIFTAVKMRHSGMYTCSASNIYGTISQSVFVKVVADPSIVIHPDNASTVRGALVTLSCGVVGSDNLLSVKWMKNGKDLALGSLISFTKQTWQNVQIYSLKILKVKRHHLGKYYCVVTNAKGSVRSNVAKVSFTRLVTPLIVKVPQPVVTTAEGSDVELKCIFIGSPAPEVTWYKDGSKLTGEGFKVVITLNNKCEAILKLSSVMTSLAGNYVCNGSSIVGNAEGNITLIVKGGSAPDIKPANQLRVAKKDSKVNLRFLVMAIALPDVTWYKDGEKLYNVTTITRHSNGTYLAELTITSVQYSDGGFYTCIVQNQFGLRSGNVSLTVKGSPEAPTNITVKRVSLATVIVSWVPGFNGGADCKFTVQFKESGKSGWTSAAERINATSTELINSEGWDGLFVFRVTAVNQFGSSEYSEKAVELKGKNNSPQQHTDDKPSTGAMVGGIIGGLLFVALIIIVVLLLRRQMKKKKKKASPKQLPAMVYTVVDEQNNTYDKTYADARGTPQEKCDTYSYVSIRPDAESVMAAGGGEYASIHRPKQWEVPKRNVRLDKTLGSGHFGTVMKGFLKSKQGTQVVAVKMLKENADQQQNKEFLAELDLMKTMAPHPNIVGLVGCCTKSDQPFIIVEYCSMGNLRDFLRSSHGSVVYANMAGNSLTLTCRDLLSFAWQCARGMSYLSSQKLVHRDLAARNILVDKGNVCKIADFGLARDIYEKKQYLKLGEAELPLRWMAVESIFHGITTTESDVWSYGILLWEIVTLGANPYPGMSRDDLIDQLRVGYRMPKPPFCSDELYAIMWQCWQKEPESRPTFLELGKTLHRLMTAQTLSIDLDNYDRSYINARQEE